MAKVGVVFGGRSVEHEVSLVSARTVARGLREAGHTVVPLGIAQDGCWIDGAAAAAALDGQLAAIPPVGQASGPSLCHLLDALGREGERIDVVFPIVHGTWGEDGTLQGLFEMLGLPYVGPGVAASALCMDKLLSKRLFADAGLPVVDFELVRQSDLADLDQVIRRLSRIPLPVFVKPRVGGSSVGVRKVASAADLPHALAFALRFDAEVLVERGITGRELECAVLGYREIESSVVGEIVPGNEFYDYEDKYLHDAARLLAPAELPPAVAERLRRLAREAFITVGGTGLARVDFLLEGEEGLFLNEINTLPGFTSISMYPRLWDLSGVPLPRLVDRLVSLALERHADRRRLDDGIKDWLTALRR